MGFILIAKGDSKMFLLTADFLMYFFGFEYFGVLPLWFEDLELVF
jgi:hypothetical protein